MEDLRVKVSADIKDLVKQIESAGGSLTDLAKTAATTSAQLGGSFSKSENAAIAFEAALERIASEGRANIQAIADAALKSNVPINTLAKNVAAFGGGVMSSRVPDYFRGLKEEATKASAVISKQVPKGANQAGNALMNLGRIAQDAPFGFIGIQNNLNPLLESFQRLQAETGSTGKSLKLLGASLLGPAGVGIALSVVSALLLKFPNLLSSLSEEAQKAAATQAEYVKELGKTSAAVQIETTKIHALLDVARNENESRAARANAIKELQKEYPGYLANINQENINSQAAKVAIDNLTGALERKYKVQAITNLLTAEQEKMFKTQNGDLSTQVGIWDALKASNFGFSSAARFGMNLLEKATTNQNKSLNASQSIISKYENELNKLIATQAEQGDFEGLTPEKVKKGAKSIADAMKDLQVTMAKIAKTETVGAITPKEADTQRLNAYSSALTQLFDRGASAANKNVKDVLEGMRQLKEVDFKDVRGPRTSRDLQDKPTPIKSINESFTNIDQNIHLHILDKLIAKQKEANDLAKLYGTNMLKIGDQLTGVFDNVFQDLISGGGNALKIFGQFIQQVIAKLLAAAAVASILTIITGGTSSLGGFSSIFSQLAGFKIPGHANGVTGFGGGMALVGERGPELVRLPQGSDVIPNHRLNQVTGGMDNIQVTGQLVARGSEILVLIERATQQQKRRG